MKNLFWVLIVILLGSFSYNCSSSSEDSKNNFHIEKYSTICKVWGVLKYYHPGVGGGNINWDKKLFDLLKCLDTISSQKDLNLLIEEVINFCDLLPLEAIDTSYLKGEIKFMRKFSWLEDTTSISQNNINRLKLLVTNKQPYNNKYVSQNKDIGNLNFIKEKSYSDSTNPSKDLRLLSLFRHWNIIYYFYPYLEINDISWERVLDLSVPKFINTEDSLSYQLAVLEYTSLLNDGHIWTESFTIVMHFGIYSPPYKLHCVENKPIVGEYFPDSIGMQFNVKIGDEILAINTIPVNELIHSRARYYPNSNLGQHNRRIYDELLITPNKDSIILDLKRNGTCFQETIPTFYLYQLYEFLDTQEKNTKASKLLNDSIGYINLRYLSIPEIDSIMASMINLNKIIIDIRNYPNGVLYELSNFFNPEPKEFVKIFMPNIIKPGEFIWWEDPYLTGKVNKRYFAGQVVLLVNEQTQSHAEFTTMCLQTASNVTTIGSMTAGTDGNVSMITLPGGIDTYFTGIGIEYPDGSPTQRIGVKIDTIIEPKIQDYTSHYDRLIEFAIQL